MTNMKLYRGLKGMTQTDLAKAVGLSKTQIVNIESGYTKNLRDENLNKICKVLEVNPIKLYGKENFIIQPTTKEEWEEIKKIVETELSKWD